MDNFGIISLYCGKSGKKGYYNNQEIGLAKALCEHNFKCYVFMPNIVDNQILEENIDDKIMVIHFPSKHIGVHSIFNCEFLLKYNLKYLQINGDNQIYVKHLANFCDKHNISKYFYIGSLGTDSKNKLKKQTNHMLMVLLLQPL